MQNTPEPDTRTRIHQRLEEAFAPVVFVDVLDQSAAHAGHREASSDKGHYRVILVSGAFDGLSPIARHRKVYEALSEEMDSSIHALSMTCMTPTEFDDD